MKLVLENFRSHESAEFAFPETGFVKLNGRSGTGKSNVFKALKWATYGKQQNVVRYGATKCQVHLQLNDLNVLRGKGPTAFEVNGTTGEAGQELICTNLGMNELEFEVSSYIAQDQANSFIHCKPAEQLDLLQRLAFSNDNPDELKAKVKALLEAAEKEASEIKGKISTTNALVESKTQQLEALQPTLQQPDTAEVDIAETQSLAAKLTKQAAQLDGEITACETSLKDPVRERLVKAKFYLDAAKEKQDEHTEWFKSNPEIAFAYDKERTETQTLVLHLTKQVSEFEDMQKRIADKNGCERKMRTYGDQVVDIIQSSTNNPLVVVNEIHEITGKYIQAKKDHDASTGVSAFLDDPSADLNAAQSELSTYEQKYNEWTGQKAIRDQKKKEALDININIDKANLLISNNAHLEPIDSLTTKIEQLRTQKQSIKDQVGALNANIKNAKSISDMWSAYRRNVRSAEDLAKSLEETRATLEIQNKTEKTISARCAKLKRFLELIQKAALTALEARIEEINIRAEHWLEVLFNGALQATIETEKESKNGNVSHKINLAIYENGTKIEKKEELSGGQQSRLALAFQLALSDMYRSPVLCLDESLKGCDSETSQICIEAIRQISERKLVLMVEHHVEDSQFDLVVNI